MVQGSVRRLVVAFLIACAIAFVLVAVKSAEAQAISSGCKGLTSDDAMWWFRQCWMY